MTITALSSERKTYVRRQWYSTWNAVSSPFPKAHSGASASLKPSSFPLKLSWPIMIKDVKWSIASHNLKLLRTFGIIPFVQLSFVVVCHIVCHTSSSYFVSTRLVGLFIRLALILYFIVALGISRYKDMTLGRAWSTMQKPYGTIATDSGFYCIIFDETLDV